MTPAARIAAAIDLLDRIYAGAAAEQVLTGWARANRYAGSGDRAEIRDLVFRALRCRRSLAVLGGAESGRGLMLGLLREDGQDPAAVFTDTGYAPAVLTAAEAAHLAQPVTPEGAEALDLPDWLAPDLQASLGADYVSVMAALRHRAPVFLRANLAKTDLAGAQAALAAEGIETAPHPLSPTALEVLSNARRVNASRAYTEGLVELQDAASQAVVDALPLAEGMRVLDFCAGGGGKSLAMAARARLRLFAHDVGEGRMRDLPVRAARARVKVDLLRPGGSAAQAPYDLILTDVPCSGSGSWRRAPEAKWRLTRARLEELCTIQAAILDEVAPLLRPGGSLAYATCSLLDAENGAQIACFLDRRPGWRLLQERRLTPRDGGDGFYLAILQRPEA
ncbi:RsmB/NOP family class I SAM-dependent RNA methyltransferase [Thioclava sp. BHET1]|nr:RsmB/NOP family class I SAM-dependent RNA methyltransferase [Thioclava sp. BHET1]